MELQDVDKFTLKNTDGFDQETLDIMNNELQEDLFFNKTVPYESFIRHNKWRILSKYYR